MRASEEFPFADDLTGLALLGGGANVIMQLSRLPVGHGVVYSPVASGNLFKRPIKRTRTTLAFLITALYGNDDERRELRKQIDRVHAHVRSGPESPVAYNAFDRELQLWVAACIYWGAEDTLRRLVREPTEQELEAFYQHGKRFGTTLQVPEELWPADRAAFEKYWQQESTRHIEFDDATRELLLGVARVKFYGWYTSLVFGDFVQFVTTGFLPPQFREPMGLPWSADKQRLFDRLIRVLRTVNRFTPRLIREFPLNVIWWHTRRRLHAGKPVI